MKTEEIFVRMLGAEARVKELEAELAKYVGCDFDGDLVATHCEGSYDFLIGLKVYHNGEQE